MLARLRAAAFGWTEDDAAQMGAASAYYALFSVAPMLVLAIALLGAFYGQAAAREQVVEQVRDMIGDSSADAVKLLLDNAQVSSLSSASVVGLISLLYGASSLFVSMRASLHRVWRLRSETNDSVVWSLVKMYLLSVLMVAFVCAFLLVLLVASAMIPLLIGKLTARFYALPLVGPLIDLGVSTLIMTILFTMTYRILSDRMISYPQILPGAVVAAILFTIGKMLIGLYLSYAGLASAYGTAGSMVVFLAWVYYSAQIVFFGAEVIRFGLPQADEPPLPAGNPKA